MAAPHPGNERPEPSAAPRHQVFGGELGAVVQAGSVAGGVHVHAGEVSGPPMVGQLPRVPPGFVNRAGELGELRGAEERATAGRGAVVVLVGPGGVGKSALAGWFLEQAAGRFGEGQLYADLGAFGPGGPVDPGEVLDAFLRALGLAPERIPAQSAQRAALFRAATRDKRLAVLLDDALSAAQVRTLLPGPGAHLVVVTTRLRLAGLVEERARFVDVAPLAPADSAALLAELGGPGAEGAGAAELARLCGHLPLALCAAAGRLVRRPGHTVADVVGELAGEHRRLAKLSREEDFPVRRVLDASYDVLPASTARAYRLAGLHPGPDLTPAGLAALAGGGEEDAAEELEDLAASSLAQPAAPGRWRLHDLVRLHAAEKAQAEEPDAQRHAALDRLCAHYLTAAAGMALALNPGRWYLAPAVRQQRRAPAALFADRAAAVAWGEAELPVLRGVVRLALDTGRQEVCWQLCEVLWPLFNLRRQREAWEEVMTAGLAAAQACGAAHGVARMLDALGYLAMTCGDPESASQYFSRAREWWEDSGHARGRASNLESLGVAATARGALSEAVEYLERSRRAHEALGNRRGAAIQERQLARAHHAAGARESAARHYRSALAAFSAPDEAFQRLRVLHGLAAVHLDDGEAAQAAALAGQAADLAEGLGARRETAEAHTLLGEAALATGDPDTARDHFTRAHAIYTELDDPQGPTIAQHLARLDRPPP